ncbi:chitin synthase-domain-containing protein [Obelidium mucronatum]|nr:chitin synthase-domain-containing protein [Obelidium mucronatum]
MSARLNPFSTAAAVESSAAPNAALVSDLAATASPTVAALTSTLRARLLEQRPTTRIGSRVFVHVRAGAGAGGSGAANPAAAAADAKAHASRNRSLDDLAAKYAAPADPSLFDASAAAWWHLKRGAEDQAIVLLGETASGKSESRRLITRHLCDISTIKSGSNTANAPKKKKSKLVSAILKVDSIMAAFGRACTPSNPNASASGSYYEYQFNKKAKIVGVKVIDLLLEKSRVTGAADGGCNFNVFYLLVEGATKEEKIQWQLSDSAHYHYLNVSGIRYVPSSNGGVDLETLRECLKSIGVGKRHQTQIFQLLAAILHLGNIAFVDDENNKKTDEPCTIKNQQQLSLVADLLGVHPSTLESCLTYKTQVIRKDKISVFLDAKAAAEQRDSFARALYSVVFSYIVEQINNSLCVTDESQWANFIAIVDLPGSYFGGSIVGGDFGNGFQRLLVNYANMKLENFMTEQLFVVPKDVLRAEGLDFPPVVGNIKKQLLDALDNESTGLLRLIDIECAMGTKGSKLIEKLKEADPQAAAVVSKKAKHMFTITHYELVSTQYDARNFVDSNSDVLQSDFVTLIRGNAADGGPGTSSPFLRGLFSDRMVATLTHAGDSGTVLAAAERGRLPSLKRPSGAAKHANLDSTVGQKVRTTLNGVLETLSETQTWFVMHLKQNDDPGHSNKHDPATFKRQIENFDLVSLCSNPAVIYSAAFKHADFVTRFNPIIVALFGDHSNAGSAKSQCEAIARTAEWKAGKAKIGASKIFLSEIVWRQLEDGLCAVEEAEKAASKGVGDQSEYGADTEYLESHAGGAGDLDDAESHFESEFGANGNNGIALTAMKGKTDAVDAAEQGRLLQNEMLSKGVKGKSELQKKKASKGRMCWVCCTWFITWWIPSPFLSFCGKMKSVDRRMAWREKFALCVIIALMNAAMLFFIIGIGLLVCPPKKEMSAGQISAKNKLGNNPMVYMYGTYYAAADKYNSHVALGAGSQGYWEAAVFGHDVSQMFDKSQYWGTYCPAFPQPAGFVYFPNQEGALVSGKWYQHGRQTPTADHLPMMEDYAKGTVVWDIGSIQGLVKANTKIIVANDRVYDVSAFYSLAYKGKNFFPQTQYIQAMFDKYSANGGDCSFELNYLKQNYPQTYADIMSCMDGLFWIGNIDHRNDLKCQVQNYILLAASAILVLVIGVKFLAALQFGGKRVPEDHDKFVICMVPCYTEGEASLAKTLESLASMEYEDKHKLIFIVADGMIIGSGNDRPTPRIVLDILGVDPALDPEPKSFQSLGEGSKQHNLGKVYSGLYEMNGRVVPYVVVVKVGRPSERQRPGNRGKRDSQLILMRFLSRVHFNQPMNPLELEMYHHMKNIIGVDPSFYEFIFSVDADTEPFKDSLNRLIAQMSRDSKIVGLCGETLLANERESWVSMMQVYEYYISHNLAKAFESLFGSVTCLPGCFSIYRIRTPVKNIPLLIAPGVLEDYSENQVDTLHLKNLLYLGEDRYLTTLLMKHFPHMKTNFISDAKCKTVGPASFAVLLSQRRRWINSTVHNLMELLMLKQLCGVCCFDMRFVVFVDLFATFVQPAALFYIGYLIYAAYVTPEQFSFPLISIIMIAAIYGFQIIIFILKREWQHIGWMIVYLLGIPFSALYIPIYAFWHFDDFTWGNTRVVIEDGQTKEVDADSEPFNPAEIAHQKWTDFEADRLKQIEANPPPRSTTPSVAAFPAPSYAQVPPMPMSGMYAQSGYGERSVYNAVPNGSVYGVPQVAGSVYAGSAYGQPMVAMPGHAGSVYGGSNYGQQQQLHQQPAVLAGYAPSIVSVSNTNRSQPSDEQILFQIRQILSTADLMTVTRKSVREELTRVFGVDLSSRKEYIHACIDGVLKGEL